MIVPKLLPLNLLLIHVLSHPEIITSPSEIRRTILTVLSANIWQDSDFQQIQGTGKCTLKIILCPSLSMATGLLDNDITQMTHIIISKAAIISGNTPSGENQEFMDLTVPHFDVLKQSPHCEKLIVFLESTGNKLYPAFKSYQLRSLLPFPFNTHPQQTHHIFLGSEEQIRQIFAADDVQTLLYKTGIISSPSPAQGTILYESQLHKELRSLSKSEYMKVVSARFDILQNGNFIVLSYPFKIVILKSKSGGGVIGTGYNLVKTLGHKYNFTFEYRCDRYKQQNKMKNGSFNGFIGALAESRADMANFFAISTERYPYIDFTPMVINTPVVFFTSLSQINVKCNFMAFLTYPEAEHVPETPEELSSRTDYTIKYIHYPGGADDTFFSETVNPVYLKIKSRMEYVNPKLMTKTMIETAEGQHIATINYLTLGLVDVAQNVTWSRNFIPVKISKQPIIDSTVQVVLRKYSKLTETISVNTGRLQNTGHFDKWFEQVLDILMKDGVSWLKRLKKLGLTESLGHKKTEEASRSTTKALNFTHFVR
ncbi:unnamed protein product, partial [Allacma fusca]